MKESQRFVCSSCGFQSTKWLGRCPECGSWNTFTEETVTISKSKASTVNSIPSLSTTDEAVSLSEIVIEPSFRFETGIAEFDRVIGGGLNKGSSILLGGEPGIGKSTLALQILAKVSSAYKVLYVCAEESAAQIKQRAMRLKLKLEDIVVYCETRLDKIVEVIRKVKPSLIVMDSLQTIASSEIESVAGSVSQIRGCGLELVMVSKQIGSAIILIGHVTKEGTLAGPKVIEHLVDTVLYFDQASDGVRLIRASKNRFGSVDELGIFRMGAEGLIPVVNSQGLFINERSHGPLPPGIAFTAVVEGSRTFLVEIQALVVQAKSGYSRVYSDKIDTSRVTRVAAILERHAGIRLSDKDIYVNVAGGIRLNDVAIELALALALYSAVTSVALKEKEIYFGELSLAGEVRPITFLEKRAKAASEIGYETAMVPKMKSTIKALKTLSCTTIKQALFLANKVSNQDWEDYKGTNNRAKGGGEEDYKGV